MNRSERTACINRILSENPNRDFPLAYFAEKFGCARSSISEDMKAVRTSFEDTGAGYLKVTAGAKGGIRFVPCISDEKSREVIGTLTRKLLEPDRRMGGGFFYTTDIMFNPVLADGMAQILARCFSTTSADVVITVETKGIGVALMAAGMLNLPLVVIRHEARITDGSTVSINYQSGSSGRLQKMSLSKRALEKGSRVIMIDDFMRGGGSLAGMQEMIREFDCSVAGTGVIITAGEKRRYPYDNFCNLVHLDDTGDEIKVTCCLPYLQNQA